MYSYLYVYMWVGLKGSLEPLYDVETAIDILCEGNMKLPSCIINCDVQIKEECDAYTAKQSLANYNKDITTTTMQDGNSDDDTSDMIKDLNHILAVRLLSSSISNRDADDILCDIRNGCIFIHVRNEFEVCVTVKGRARVAPYRVLTITMKVIEDVEDSLMPTTQQIE